MDARFWDERYGSRDQLFSGDPNGVLVTEVTGLPPGQALDAGCGEGADTLWLSRRGWLVTGVCAAVHRSPEAARLSRGPLPRRWWSRGDHVPIR